MEIIKNKHILLDTNILINSAKYQTEFEVFFDELKQNNISPTIDNAIKLEFLRSANTQRNLSIKINYLNLLLGNDEKRLDLPITEDTLIDARRISNLYYFLNLKKQKISFVDSIISAQLKKYSSNLFFATINNQDFPLQIFDRLFVTNVDANSELFTIGIYAFSEKKYNIIVDKFSKTI
jgi:rRNA-processing protein FCF1